MASLAPLPADPTIFLDWTWPDFEPYFTVLLEQPLSADCLDAWLSSWSALSEHVDEISTRLYIATAQDTADAGAEARYHRFIEETYPSAQKGEQALREKLLASGLEPADFEVPLRKIRADVALFCADNLPLQTSEQKLEERYNRIVGAQTVNWDGHEVPIPQLSPAYQELDRDRRELAWRAAAARQLLDRDALNQVWQEYLKVRLPQAHNAGLSDYREYRWQELQRFDYEPADCERFHHAIAAVAVPAATRILEQRRLKLGIETIRPWDTQVDPSGQGPLRPYQSVEELCTRAEAAFSLVDPDFGRYFQLMKQEGFLDLESRSNKGPGGFCSGLHVSKRPFIFMNAVGIHDDVQTMLHEGGHAFHMFEALDLPWYQQRDEGHEFAEVASMSMELLAAPYLDDPACGFYTTAEAARARIAHLENIITFWPYMAVVDAFQHWAYTNPDAAADPAQLDEVWAALYQRYLPAEDWTGLGAELATGWQRKLHIFTDPFYYVEYGLAQLGAVQVWANARHDQATAVARYRRALALGGTRSIPKLYAAAGAKFAFDAETLREAVGLVETVITELEAAARDG